MLKVKTIKILAFFSLFFLLSSCWPETYEKPSSFRDYKPIVMTRADFESSVVILDKKEMNRAGKIYLKDTWMILGDENTGFHIYDNSNPKQPVEVAFLNLPGATDLAIRGDVFYANQAVDLLAFKIDIESKKVVILKRLKNIFPEKVSPDGYSYSPGSDNIVTDWQKK